MAALPDDYAPSPDRASALLPALQALRRGDFEAARVLEEGAGVPATLARTLNAFSADLAAESWRKAQLKRLTRRLQGQRDLHAVARLVLEELAPLVHAHQGVLYVRRDEAGRDPRLELFASFAPLSNRNMPKSLHLGEGLVGESAAARRTIVLDPVPSDYLRVGSGLGSAAPACVAIVPIVFEGRASAVLEVASFRRFESSHIAFLEELSEHLGMVFHTIEAAARTEGLLEQSRALARQLQSRRDELQAANQLLQDKAEELALSSRYKTEFLANMSHELRTPLNGLLILATMLADNAAGNLTQRQVEYAQNIHDAGTDLLSLITDILDLAKIESGTVTLHLAPERYFDVVDYVERTFVPVARGKGLEFAVELAPGLPPALFADAKRLQQILKNLVSNAVKFTLRGTVRLRIAPATSGWTPGHATLDHEGAVVAFTVTDTGIGIPENKQRIIFAAFQQADGTTSREFGGTGLGLSISEQLAKLMGGEIQVQSVVGQGSTFTLFLPARNPPAGTEHGMASAGMATGLLREPASRTHQADAPPPTVPEAARGHDPVLAGRKVLIVDDDIRNIYALACALEERGMDVVEAGNGMEALERLQSNPGIDIVLMDLMMPELDGLATIRIIRGLEEFRSLPIIAVTAKAMQGDREESLEAGATDYLAKPVDLPELATRMKALIS